MFSIKVFRSLRSLRCHQMFEPIMSRSLNLRSISMSSKLRKIEDKKEKTELSDLEQRMKRLLSEYVDPSSPFTGFIDRLLSKPWITFFGEKTKKISIKERKETSNLRNGMFRMAFDLTGFTTEEIRVLLSEGKIYIEAKKEEESTDGSKAWREMAYECSVSRDIKPDSVGAFLDSGGLLVIEGEVRKDKVQGIKSPKNDK